MTAPGYTPAHGSPADGEQGAAIGPGPVMTPAHGGSVDPVNVMGDPDAGGRDDAAGTVQGAADAANARWHEHQGDAHAAGRIGDTLDMPASPLDPGVGSLGTTDPAGAFYDPPREYTSDPGGSGAPVQAYPVDPSGN